MPSSLPFGNGVLPLPNRLVDEVLPALKDTELRVLLVVFRQTWGWQVEGKRKHRDWLSHAQLCRRTGRGSEPVSKAVDALVRQELIIVEDSAGNAITTPEARRRHLGRLYFRPGDMWKTANVNHPAKAGTTTNNRDNKKSSLPVQSSNSDRLWRSPGCRNRGGGWHRAVAAIPPDLGQLPDMTCEATH